MLPNLPKVRGRSAAPGWLWLVVAGGGPPFPPTAPGGSPGVGGKPGGVVGPGGSVARGRACSQGSHWFALRFNQLIGRPLARPAVGRCRSVAELLPVITGLVYDVFWLLSCGF